MWGQLPDETECPVAPKPPRAATETPEETDDPERTNAVDVVVDDDRRQVEPPDDPQRE